MHVTNTKLFNILVLSLYVEGKTTIVQWGTLSYLVGKHLQYTILW